jgi:hypothetical protein
MLQELPMRTNERIDMALPKEAASNALKLDPS